MHYSMMYACVWVTMTQFYCLYDKSKLDISYALSWNWRCYRSNKWSLFYPHSLKLKCVTKDKCGIGFHPFAVTELSTKLAPTHTKICEKTGRKDLAPFMYQMLIHRIIEGFEVSIWFLDLFGSQHWCLLSLAKLQWKLPKVHFEVINLKSTRKWHDRLTWCERHILWLIKSISVWICTILK